MESIFFGSPAPIEVLCRESHSRHSRSEASMLDALFVVAGLAFFALATGYVLICERL
jgi:hypothetical protein